MYPTRLVVLSPFAGFTRGQYITSPTTIQAIWDGSNRNKVADASLTGGSVTGTLFGVPVNGSVSTQLTGLTYTISGATSGSVQIRSGSTVLSQVSVSGASGSVSALTLPSTAGAYAVVLLVSGAVRDSHIITVAAVDAGPSVTINGPSATAVAGQAATFTVAFTGISAVYVVLRTGGSESGSRVLLSTPGTVQLTPPSAGSYTACVYDTAFAGTNLTETPPFSVGAPAVSTASIAGPLSVAIATTPASFFVTRQNITTVYAVLRTGGADVGSRVAVNDDGVVQLTAGTTGSFVARLYDASSAGTLLDETQSFTVFAASAGGAVVDQAARDAAAAASTLAAAAIPATQKGAASGVATLGSDSKLTASQVPSNLTGVDQVARDAAAAAIPSAQKGVANGIATLGSDGKLLSAQTPVGTGGATVDQVLAAARSTGQSLVDAESEMRSKTAGATPGTLVDRAPITVSTPLAPIHNGGFYRITGPGITLTATALGIGGDIAANAEGHWSGYWNRSGGPITLAGVPVANISTGSSTVANGQIFFIGVSGGEPFVFAAGGAVSAASTPAIGLSAISAVASGATYTLSGTLQGYTSDPTLTAVVDGSALTGVTWTFSGPSGARTGYASSAITAPAAGSHTALVKDGNNVQSNGGTPVTFTVSAAAPAVPGPVRNIQVAAQNSSGFTASWDAPNTGGTVDSIRVRYRVTGNSTWITAAASLDPSALIYTFTGLVSSTTYDVEVSTINNGGTQITSVTTTGTTTAAGAAFVGPLDAYETGTATAYSAMRRLLSSYTGALIRVRNGSTQAETDIGADTAGLLSTSALTSAAGGADLFVAKIYDQRQGIAAVQAVATRQPKIVSAGTRITIGANARSCPLFTQSANQELRTAASVAFSGTDFHAIATLRTPSAGTCYWGGAWGSSETYASGANPTSPVFLTDTNGTRIRAYRTQTGGAGGPSTVAVVAASTDYVSRLSWRGGTGGTARIFANGTEGVGSNGSYAGSMGASGNTVVFGSNGSGSGNGHNDRLAEMILFNAATVQELTDFDAATRAFVGV